MKGTIFYYAPDANPGYLILHNDDGSLKIFTGSTNLEDLSTAPDTVRNGDIWQIAFDRKDNKAFLEEKGTTFSNKVDKNIRAVDDLIRSHYANMESGNFNAAMRDFSKSFVQRIKSKKALIDSWKKWKGVPNCGKAPSTAIKFTTQTDHGIQAEIDGDQFVQDEKNNYNAAFTKEDDQWKFQSVSLVP